MATRKDPYLDYRFQVEVDSLLVGGFSEVSGLGYELQTEDYEEGGVNGFVHQLPTRISHENVTLQRGLTDATELFDWAKSTGQGSINRRNCRIFLANAVGEERWGWEIRDAYPVSWEGPTLQADSGEVAMESLELAHRGLSRIDGLPQ